MSISANPGVKPVVPFMKIPSAGAAYLEGRKCRGCGEIYLVPRAACPRCCSRAEMQTVRLAESGTLYNYTIVYRSFPGVKTPFVSAIVDLDGGGSVKGNLVDVEPHPDAIRFDMPVRVVFRDAQRKDREGAEYLAYFFVPASAA